MSARNDVSSLKARRAVALKYLGPQFRRAEAAHYAMVDFINNETSNDCVLITKDVETFVDQFGWDRMYEKVVKALDPVLEYAISFKRDMPPKVRIAIRKQQRRIDLIYSSMERSSLLSRLRNGFESREFLRFSEWLQVAVDELSTPYRDSERSRWRENTSLTTTSLTLLAT